jgi:glycosyltransferase involved in cell wall biosynthesis
MRLALDARKLTDYGIGTYLTALVRGLAARSDVQLTLVVREGHEERAAMVAPDARLVTVGARGYTVAEHFAVPAALWRERFDLVHFPHYVLPALIRGPAVVTVHDVIQLFYPPAERRTLAMLYLRTVMRRALKRARRVITVSRTSRNDLIQLFQAEPRRLVVVPNGVDPALAVRPDGAVIDDLKTRYGLKPPLVLVVANDKPHKNLDVVLRAWHLATRRHRMPGQLVLVGSSGPGGRLATRASRLGLDGRVRCLGRVPAEDLHGLYHVGALLLHVALYEGFGLPVLEAMRAELPVVTSNLGAMREVGEGAARLVNPLDVDEIAAALERVLVDDPLRRRMVDAGRRRAESLTWERMVEGTLAVYRQAMGETGS